jgi:hypothetical protein
MVSFAETTGGTQPRTGDGRTVGVVKPQLARFDTPLKLACGKSLPSYELAYERTARSTPTSRTPC